MTLTPKKFEIFSGTGGVGKTTLATSRAIELAQAGYKCLLITIDPAKRLKELLGLTTEQSGEVINIPDPLKEGHNLGLDVELMNPEKTFARVAEICGCSEVLDNRILKILTRPYGGLNEILAIVELDIQFKTKKYDVIILDTPPGSHFLDFLDSVERINLFFDQSFIDIFNYIGKKVDTSSLSVSKKIFNKVVGAGVSKLLGYLNKVTGEKFVEEFIDAIIAIYKTKSAFLEAMKLQNILNDHKLSNWYLVTSVEQSKIKEALELMNQAQDLITKESYIIVNKCLEDKLEQWDTTNDELIKLKDVLLKKEHNIKNDLQKHFKQVITFPEVISLSPLEHVKDLTLNWQNI